MEIGLSARATEAWLVQGADPFGATSRVIANASEAVGRIHKVELATGDALVVEGRAAPPNVLKIDVEGFELDVLQGMPKQLASPLLKHIFIEVHFTLLEERGLDGVPSQIERLLRAAGFAVEWLDPSHIHARRTSQ